MAVSSNPDDLNVVNDVNESVQTVPDKQSFKVVNECGDFLNELRKAKEELVENEAFTVNEIETHYDEAIRQLQEQRLECVSAINTEYKNRLKYVERMMDAVEAIETNYASLSKAQEDLSDSESVGSGVFSDLESPSSELASPETGSEPAWVFRGLGTLNEPSFVFGKNGVEPGEFRNLRGIAVDYQNRIYVVDCGNKRIQIFDEEANFLQQIGSMGTEDGQFLFPVGITIGKHNIYVTDSERHNIQSFSLSGDFLSQAGNKGPGSLQFNAPCGVALGTEGRLFIADYFNNRIQVFTSKLKYKSRFGHKELRQPCDVCFTPKQEVIVVDSGTLACVHVYKQSGMRLRDFVRKSNLCFLHTINPDYTILASDCDKHVIKFFSQSGELLRTVGSKGSESGRFIHPQGVTVDYKGRMLVCDSVNNRIQIF